MEDSRKANLKIGLAFGADSKSRVLTFQETDS
jgi:hypothetical protein